MEALGTNELFIALILILIISLLFNGFLMWQTHKRAERLHQSWREGDLDKARAELALVARKEAEAGLQQWKIESELSIRQDAILRSQAVIKGKVTEHLAPHMPIFPFNPKDARFVGSPIDFLVFDGADEGNIRDVIFLEVKTGASSLNPRQRQIRDAILAGRVMWRELRIGPER
ncbi:MAG: Holliday junction resolvase-like protein [Blastocatellia bacterium]